MKLRTLKERYAGYLNKFNRTGKHPHPAELLSLLILPEKDKYLPITGNSGEFYEYYKDNINEKIEQVIVDFAITKNEIIEYIEKTVICNEEKYEEYKVWFVFGNGFSVLQWGLMYHPDWSPERLHNAFSAYWGREPIPDHLIEESNTHTKPKKRSRAKRKISTITTGFNF